MKIKCSIQLVGVKGLSSDVVTDSDNHTFCLFKFFEIHCNQRIKFIVTSFLTSLKMRHPQFQNISNQRYFL